MTNRLSGIFIIGFFLILAFFQCYTLISPGYVGVLVNQFGSSKGVEDKELHVGAHWIAPWKSVYRFPVFEQNHIWEGNECFSFQTGDGMAVSADVGITFHLNPTHVPKIFQKYRRGMDEITHIFMRNYIRDAMNKAASKVVIEDLYGAGKEQFFDEVQEHVHNELSQIGIEVSRIYLIGRFEFPSNVIHALNSKIEANQRAQQRENELREAEAQARKEIARAKGEAECQILEAKACADANKLLSESLTDELIIWEALRVWDGVLPQVVGGAQPLLQLK